MTKIRVHELAKELAIDNKELLELLKSKEIEVKSHMSSVDGNVAEEVRKMKKGSSGGGETLKKQSAGGPAKKEAPNEESVKEASIEAALEELKTEEKKSKNVVRVFRVENTKQGGKLGGDSRIDGRQPRPRPEGAGRRPLRAPEEIDGQPRRRPRPEGAGLEGNRPRPEGAGRRPEGARTRPEGARPRPEGARPRPEGALGEGAGRRPEGAGRRPEGARPRPEGARPRPEGALGEGAGRRPEGARPRPEGAGRRPEGTRPEATPPERARPETAKPEGARPREEQETRLQRDIPRPVGGEDKRTLERPPRREEQRTGNEQEKSSSRSVSEGPRREQGTRPTSQADSSARRRSPEGGGRPLDQRSGAPRGEGRGRSPEGGGRPSDQRPGAPRGDGRGRSPEGGGRPSDQRSGAPRGDGRGRPGEGGRQGRPAGPGGSERRGKDAAAPITEQQKGGRGKGKEKDKEKDVKKQENRGGSFDNRSRKGKKPAPEVQKPQVKEVKKAEQIKQIILPETLTIKDLADKMKLVPSVIIKKLFLQGKIVTLNQEIDYETAEEIAMEFDVLCEKEVVIDVIEELLKEDDEDESKLIKRPPVVCVMGHVDHGKTSLLDAIRDANVMGREAGGITQHIGAYTVSINGEDITFLDTPGHEAFTSMRMRGASSTDIAILVVAADDGVMPQTIEAISHAKAAGVEIIVAINKVDKPSANVERVKQELTEYELIPEDWGGSTVFVPVSAKTRDGITELLEMIILTSEVMELKANPKRTARGLVIESLLDKGKGSVATVLVQKGTLRVGDSIAAGSAYGKVRAMMDHMGKRVKEAGPSMPVEILGLNGVPNAGEVFVGCENEKDARAFGETFISQNRVKMLDDTKSKMSLDDLFTQIQVGNLKELNIIVKGDVQGSVEAIKQSLLKLSNEEVVIKIIHGGVGAINESDVILASTSNAIIIGFNVRPDGTAKETADREGVDMRLYKVIYNAIEDVEVAMKGMLDPIFEEKVLGHAEIRQIFKASGIGNIAGSYILDGTFERGCKVRVSREGKIIFDGALASLKRFKDDVKEVRAGYECGLVFDGFNDVKEEDKVEAYKMVEVERK